MRFRVRLRAQRWTFLFQMTSEPEVRAPQVAYEHDEDFRSHLPTLFHVAVVSMDCVEGV